ncbi:MAG: aldo/keto reductase [Dermatophilaceae bacterium]
MRTRRLGPFEVGSIGLGCMSLSHAYGIPPSPEDAAAVLRRAVELGVTHVDTAALYGFGANERLVGQVLSAERDRFVLASKCGMLGVDGKRVIDGRPEVLIRTCDEALARLRTDVIDVYYLHRWDKTVPVEESIGALGELVAQGKIRAIGISEVSADTLRRAHATHPIAALQNEYSLWSRNPELGTLEACRELGIALVAFSPLGRGFLTGRLTDVSALPANDIRRFMPRFEPSTYAANLAVLGPFQALAQEAGVLPGQLALAWLLAQDEGILPIPGTTNLAHLAENVAAADLDVDPGVLARAGEIVNQATVIGERYNAATQREIDTEQFPAPAHA